MCWAENLILNDRHHGYPSPVAFQTVVEGLESHTGRCEMQPSSGGIHTQPSVWEELVFPGHIHGVYTVSIPVPSREDTQPNQMQM